jgi:Ran-binding protein 1
MLTDPSDPTVSAEEPTNAPAAAGEEESTATFEPVVRLSETVEVKTHEEDEEALFKMSVLDPPSLFKPWGRSGGVHLRTVTQASEAHTRPELRLDHRVCTLWEVTSCPGTRFCGHGWRRSGFDSLPRDPASRSSR